VYSEQTVSLQILRTAIAHDMKEFDMSFSEEIAEIYLKRIS
jgi:hypothetical protein